MFLIARFDKIDTPTFFEKIRFTFSPIKITTENHDEYSIADIQFINNIDYEELQRKLSTLGSNIVLAQSCEADFAQKYGFFYPQDFLLKTAVNTVCSLVYSSEIKINQRQVTFCDPNALHTEIAMQLVEHFFGVNIITDNPADYDSFAKSVMDKFGAIIIIKKSESKDDNFVIYSGEDCGKFRIFQKIFECFDAKSMVGDAPENVNKLSFAAAMAEFSLVREYDNICADVFRENLSDDYTYTPNIIKYINKHS